MKTTKLLVILFVITLITTACATQAKRNGLHTNLNQKPVPVAPGPMTRAKLNIFGLRGPGTNLNQEEGTKVTSKTTRTVPNSKGHLHKNKTPRWY